MKTSPPTKEMRSQLVEEACQTLNGIALKNRQLKKDVKKELHDIRAGRQRKESVTPKLQPR